MQLDYSRIVFDADGAPEMPELQMRTMSGEVIGTIPGVYNLRLNIKFSEPSEIEFDVPAVLDGMPNWIYDQLSGHKIVYTDYYGVYVMMNPSEEMDGITDVMHMKGYSLEYTLNSKKFFLAGSDNEEETSIYAFYDPAAPDTSILHRIIECAPGWSVGYIAPGLRDQYGWFEQYDDYLLSFMYGAAKERFRCIFVFDTYNKTINAYDADEDLEMLPIYLDFDNLLQSTSVAEMSEELVTAMRPYGSEGLDIINVNPTGSPWIYDLSFFIENGDLPDELARKWGKWLDLIDERQADYIEVSARRALVDTERLHAEAKLTDLQGELSSLREQQNMQMQAFNMADPSTESGQTIRDEATEKLDELSEEVAEQEALIASQQAAVDTLQTMLDPNNPQSYESQRQAIVRELAYEAYFTEAERAVLAHYMIEQDMTDETFVSTNINGAPTMTLFTTPKNDGYRYDDPTSLAGYALDAWDSKVTKLDGDDKVLYSMVGGLFTFRQTEDEGLQHELLGNLISGTLDVTKADGSFVFSAYVNALMIDNEEHNSATITMSGTLHSLVDTARPLVIEGVVTDVSEAERGSVGYIVTEGTMSMSTEANGYQEYAVQKELYDFAKRTLHEVATPTYEFSIESGNFLFASEFAQFRNSLKLGSGIYLNVDDRRVINPYLIELAVDFEDSTKLSLVFSNRFKRHDNVNTLKEMLERTYSSSRSIDASKYAYNRTVGQQSYVSQFMKQSFESARNTIIGARDQSVIIDGSGITVRSDVKDEHGNAFEMRIVNGMIAMTNDNWQTADLAIGAFYTDSGFHTGINAHVIAGELLIGKELLIEAETNDEIGIKQFRFDGTGAWLNNATLTLQNFERTGEQTTRVNGQILISPEYGILAGSGDDLFAVAENGYDPVPAFINTQTGDIITDTDGMPQNANFFLDLRDGSAYFRGKVISSSGKIGGFTLGAHQLSSGTDSGAIGINSGAYDLNGNPYGEYAFWAGDEDPTDAAFSVKKDGTIKVKQGQITTGNATKQSAADGHPIVINVNDKFYVDNQGDVWLDGDVHFQTNPTAPFSRDTLLGVLEQPSGSDTWAPADGIYNDHGYIRINASYITTGQLDGDRIVANSIKADRIDIQEQAIIGGHAGFSDGEGLDGNKNITHGALMFSNDNWNNYILVSDAGIRLNVGSANLWMSQSQASISVPLTADIRDPSDYRIKNSISYDMGQYEAFFRGLKPATFKLNADGQTAKKRIGFIAQEIQESMALAGLTDNDFYGLYIDADGNHYMSLKYSEFIALNTHMIQKLYARIDELESKLASGWYLPAS